MSRILTCDFVSLFHNQFQAFIYKVKFTCASATVELYSVVFPRRMMWFMLIFSVQTGVLKHRGTR